MFLPSDPLTYAIYDWIAEMIIDDPSPFRKIAKWVIETGLDLADKVL